MQFLVPFVVAIFIFVASCHPGVGLLVNYSKNLNLHFNDSEISSERKTVREEGAYVSLDVRDDVSPGSGWVVSTTNIKKWFEYYDNTDDLISAASDASRCPFVISDTIDQLEPVNGIWVACQDPTLPPQCYDTPGSPCHPVISLSKSFGIAYRAVRIQLLVRELAIVRLTVIKSNTESRCLDYSQRRDPFSACEYVEVDHATQGWIQVQLTFGDDEDFQAAEFQIQLITRFKDDGALVDKIEAAEILCDNEGDICTPATTVPPEYTTSAMTTPMSSDSTTQTTPTSIASSTTVTVTTTTTLPTTVAPPLESILNVEEDSKVERWQLPDLLPEWLDYHDASSSVQPSNNTGSCDGILYSVVEQLPDVEGLWSSCHQEQSWRNFANEGENQDDSSYPVIKYAVENERVKSITVKLHLSNTALVRLHAGNRCIDFSNSSDPSSVCEFWRIPQEDRWQQLFWRPRGDQALKEFRMELITSSLGDLVLLDWVKVIYSICYDENCSEPTTTVPSSTIISTTNDATEGSSKESSQTTTPISSTSQVAETTSMPIDWILDSQNDLVDDKTWEIPNLDKNWLEYHDNSVSITPTNDTFTCASILYSVVEQFPETEGLWSSCFDPNQPLLRDNSGEKPMVSEYPVIRFSADKQHVTYVNVEFYLTGLALIRLQVGKECIDYSWMPNPYNSTCEFRRLDLENGGRWQGFVRKSRSEKVMDAKIEMMARFHGDLVLLNKIKIQTNRCGDNQCPTTTTARSNTGITNDPPEVTGTPGSSTENTNASDTSTDSTESSESDALALRGVPMSILLFIGLILDLAQG